MWRLSVVSSEPAPWPALNVHIGVHQSVSRSLALLAVACRSNMAAPLPAFRADQCRLWRSDWLKLGAPIGAMMSTKDFTSLDSTAVVTTKDFTSLDSTAVVTTKDSTLDSTAAVATKHCASLDSIAVMTTKDCPGLYTVQLWWLQRKQRTDWPGIKWKAWSARCGGQAENESTLAQWILELKPLGTVTPVLFWRSDVGISEKTGHTALPCCRLLWRTVKPRVLPTIMENCETPGVADCYGELWNPGCCRLLWRTVKPRVLPTIMEDCETLGVADYYGGLWNPWCCRLLWRTVKPLVLPTIMEDCETLGGCQLLWRTVKPLVLPTIMEDCETLGVADYYGGLWNPWCCRLLWRTIMEDCETLGVADYYGGLWNPWCCRLLWRTVKPLGVVDYYGGLWNPWCCRLLWRTVKPRVLLTIMGDCETPGVADCYGGLWNPWVLPTIMGDCETPGVADYYGALWNPGCCHFASRSDSSSIMLLLLRVIVDTCDCMFFHSQDTLVLLLLTQNAFRVGTYDCMWLPHPTSVFLLLTQTVVCSRCVCVGTCDCLWVPFLHLCFCRWHKPWFVQGVFVWVHVTVCACHSYICVSVVDTNRGLFAVCLWPFPENLTTKTAFNEMHILCILIVSRFDF